MNSVDYKKYRHTDGSYKLRKYIHIWITKPYQMDEIMEDYPEYKIITINTLAKFDHHIFLELKPEDERFVEGL